MNSIEGLTGMLSGLQVARFTSAAATTIYLYDTFLTLDLEVSRHEYYSISTDPPPAGRTYLVTVRF